MSAIADLVLNNGAATPVAKTFKPDPDIASSLPRWVDRSGGIALGYPAITLSMRRPTKAARSYKVVAKVELPVLEVASVGIDGFIPPPTKSYSLLCNMEFVLPERCSLAERKDILAFAANLLASTPAGSAIKDFEPVY